MMTKTTKQKPKLTLKQQRFVEAYMGKAQGNATEAARIAGYKGNQYTLKQVASENLAKPYILTAIEARRELEESHALLTRKGRQEWLLKFILTPFQEPQHRLKAIEMLSKMDGDFLERRQIEAKVQVEDVRNEVRERLLTPELWADLEGLGEALKLPTEIKVEN